MGRLARIFEDKAESVEMQTCERTFLGILASFMRLLLQT